MTKRTIKYDKSADHHAVIGEDGYIMECFGSKVEAESYLAEFEEMQPKTAGENCDLAKKHGALYRN